MQLSSTTATCDVFSLQGELKISQIPTIGPLLTKHIQANPDKDLAIDLAAVNFMDSSGLNLLVNLNKRLTNGRRKLFLVSPSNQIAEMLSTLKLDKILSVVHDREELDSHATAEAYRAYLAYTRAEGNLRRLNCSCPVCGSNVTSGYLVDRQAYGWRWEDAQVFPSSYDRQSGKEIDLDSLLPIVCLDCFLAFTDVSFFDIIEGDQPVFPSCLDERGKQLLQKALKRRKDTMDIDVVVGDTFFDPPRTPTATHLAYLLAAHSARAIADHDGHTNACTVMWLHCMGLKYAPESKRNEQRENCRAWIAQILGSGSQLTALQKAQANYMLMNITLGLGRTRDAQSAYESLRTVEASLPPGEPMGIDDPRFWLTQGHNIWEQHTNSA